MIYDDEVRSVLPEMIANLQFKQIFTEFIIRELMILQDMPDPIFYQLWCYFLMHILYSASVFFLVLLLWFHTEYGFVKINVHGFFTEQPPRNEKRLGIGMVVGNHRGKILRMVAAGSLGVEERRIVEFCAMLYGLIRAFLEDRVRVTLETKNLGAYWEWRNSKRDGVVLEYRLGGF